MISCSCAWRSTAFLSSHQVIATSLSDFIHSFLHDLSKQDNLAGIRRLHCVAVSNGLDTISLLGDHLIRLFASHERLLEANNLFRKFDKRSVYTWNAIITAQVSAGHWHDAFLLFHKMKEEVTPNRITYLTILKACHMMGEVDQLRSVHEEINASECRSNVVIANTLIDTYGKLSRLDDAFKVFSGMVNRDVVSWGTMISVYVQHGDNRLAIETFKDMQSLEIKADAPIFASVLKACAQMGAVEGGNLIHALILNDGHKVECDVLIGNALIDMYGKCACLSDAQYVFDNLFTRDAVSWSIMIAGYATNGCEFVAFECFEEMLVKKVNPIKTTYLSVLKACGSAGVHQQVRIIHDRIIKREKMLDQEVGNMLLDVYCKCHQQYDAQSVFDSLPLRNDVSCNALIAAYAGNGKDILALELFEKMQEEGLKPSELTVSVILKICGSTNALERGKLIHSKIIRNQLPCDNVVQNSLLDMYVKCGDLKEAQKAFDDMIAKDVVSWAIMISGNVQHGYSFQALKIFDELQRKGIESNDMIFSSLLVACGDLGYTREGMFVHNKIIQDGSDANIRIGNTLIDMYGKFGNLDEASKVFIRLHHRDSVSWATFIAGYVQHGYAFHALGVYARSQEEEIEVSRVIFLHVLKACGIIGAMEQTRLIHHQISDSAFYSDEIVSNTIIDSYAKCGGVEEAQFVFNKMHKRTTVTWAAMITGYAACGECLLAWQCICNMQKHGLEPDRVIFSSLLSACSNSGLLGEGLKYFTSMIEDFSVVPDIEHFSCIVDLLSRAGNISEANDVISTLPFSPDPVVWRSLLANSKTYNHVEIATYSFNEIFEEDPTDSSGFAPLLCIHSVVQRWGDFGMHHEECEARIVIEKEVPTPKLKPCPQPDDTIKSTLRYC